MGGLGLGAFVLGRVADRRAAPARMYGVLEIAIGLFGLASAWIFDGVGAGYLAVARALGPGIWTATAIKFAAAFAVLLVPTFLMGGTLPVLTRAFAGARSDQFRRQLALFYGLNTLGGVAGCVLAGYVLVEHVGLRGTLLGVGVVNLALGVVALWLGRNVVPEVVEEPAPTEEDPGGPEADDEPTRRLALRLIALTAFASLLYEIAWTRVLVLVVGSSTYAFTTILAAFLAGIGIGSLLAVGRGRPARDLLLFAALSQGGIAVLAALLFPFFRALPVYIVGTMQVGFLGAGDLLALHGAAVAAVVFPPAVCMGLSFPLLAELSVGSQSGTGSGTGRAYFANTLGSITGSVLTGFVLIHLLGSERTLLLGVLINAGAAVLLVWWLVRTRGNGVPGPSERIALLLAALALLVAFATPGWSRRTLDRGPVIYGREHMTPGQLDAFLRGLGAEQLSFEEGWNAAVSVWRNGGATWLKTNGKSDASSVVDMNTQTLVGLLPALAHPHPRRAFVVGFGSGVSVRALADVPEVERVDVVEIERAVLRASRFFDAENRGVLSDPKVRVIEDDARSALQLAREPYDIIASEPSNPWIAGIASLFTADYFRIAASRLRPDGILAQWLQTYRVPPSLVAVVVANVREVFPHVQVWYANPSDLIVLASRQPIVWRRERVARLTEEPGPIRNATRDYLRMDRPDQLLGLYLLGEQGVARLAAGAAFAHSDDRPALEFVAARHLLVGPHEGMAFDSLLAVKLAARDTVPSLAEWPVSQDDVLAAYAHMLPATSDLAIGIARRLVGERPDDPERQAELGRVLFERRDFQGAVGPLDAALAKRPDDGRILVQAAIAHYGSGDTAAARPLMLRAREAGGDSTFVASLLAEIAARRGQDSIAATEALRALRGLRPTIASPFPAALDNAVKLLAARAGPDVAGAVFDLAAATRPSWDLAYWGGAQVYARGGALGCRRAQELASQLPRFGWRDGEIVTLLRPCLQSQRR